MYFRQRYDFFHLIPYICISMRYYFNTFSAVLLIICFVSFPMTASDGKTINLDREAEIFVDSCSGRFNAKQLILPGVLISVGAFGVNNGWMKRVKKDLNREMLHLSGGHHFSADNFIQYLPAASYIALGELKGITSSNNLSDRMIITATSFAVMCAIVQLVKHIVHERRPDKQNFFDSFPSGHTATAFMGAELVRSEYSTGLGIAAYGTACGIGFLRLYNNRHWLNDVIAGAGIGILSSRIGILMLPVWKRLFQFDDKHGINGAFMPTYDAYGRGLQLRGILVF